MNKRIIYYYQTFSSLEPLLIQNSLVTHIHLSSIHFGLDNLNKPYIHLNDNCPDDNIFIKVWSDLDKAKRLGITIILMIGGAGGAFNTLFSDFNTYYNLLKNTIIKHNCITGIDLDIEENTSIKDIKKLINKIKDDFGKDFIITMAPVASSLQGTEPGMGGFVYKDFFNSNEGKLIDYFNGQFYYDINEEAYEKVINNGFPPDKIVYGMESGNDLNEINLIIENLSKKYSNFGGVFIWEYFNAFGKEDPYNWALLMHKSMNPKWNLPCVIS